MRDFCLNLTEVLGKLYHMGEAINSHVNDFIDGASGPFMADEFFRSLTHKGPLYLKIVPVGSFQQTEVFGFHHGFDITFHAGFPRYMQSFLNFTLHVNFS